MLRPGRDSAAIHCSDEPGVHRTCHSRGRQVGPFPLREQGDRIMISDLCLDRYYYVFDSRQSRTVVLDRRTGEEVDWREMPRIQLMAYAAERVASGMLRDFARQCARYTDVQRAADETPTERLWSAAQRVNGTACALVRREVLDAVVRAATLDLPRGRSDAARLLTVYACTHPNALQGAIDAAHMSERWAAFVDDDPRTAVRQVRQWQVDWILDVLGARA